MIRFNFKKYHKKILLTAVALAAALTYFYFFWQTENLRIFYFDIGQGHSTLIRTADGTDVLIDGGPDKTILAELGAARPFWDRNIEYVILTHPHLDHFYGLIEVLRRYQVGSVYLNGMHVDNEYFQEFMQAIGQSGAQLIIPEHYQTLKLEDLITMEILNPLDGEPQPLTVSGNDGQVINDSSLVVRFDYKNFEALIAGDIEAGQEERLVLEKSPIDADVLLAPHHGSKSSSMEKFLQAVNPGLVVISAGAKNNYHHPHPSVLSRYQSLKIPYLRTDQSGTILIESDGLGYWRK